MVYAIVANGAVENMIEWDGVTTYSPPAGTTLVMVPDGTYTGVGATYANGVFSPPNTGSIM